MALVVFLVAAAPLLAYGISPNPELFIGHLTDVLVDKMASGELFHLGTAYLGVIYWAVLSAVAGLSLAYGFFWDLPWWPEKIILTLTSGFIAIGFVDGLAALVLPWLFGGTAWTFRQPVFFYAALGVYLAIGILAHNMIDVEGEIW